MTNSHKWCKGPSLHLSCTPFVELKKSVYRQCWVKGENTREEMSWVWCDRGQASELSLQTRPKTRQASRREALVTRDLEQTFQSGTHRVSSTDHVNDITHVDNSTVTAVREVNRFKTLHTQQSSAVSSPTPTWKLGSTNLHWPRLPVTMKFSLHLNSRNPVFEWHSNYRQPTITYFQITTAYFTPVLKWIWKVNWKLAYYKLLTYSPFPKTCESFSKNNLDWKPNTETLREKPRSWRMASKQSCVHRHRKHGMSLKPASCLLPFQP